MTTTQSRMDGTVSEDELRWLDLRAQGGFGTIVTSATAVSSHGRTWAGAMEITSDAHIPGLAEMASTLRARGAVSALQLHHGGRRADPGLTGGGLFGPWAEPEKGVLELSTEGVRAIVSDFVSGAVRAEQAGFDGVEIHGAHGYLPGQFLDPKFNTRTDKYGGMFTNRARFLTEVLEGIRSTTGSNFQLGARITPERYNIPLFEGKELATRLFASDLLDYLDVSLWDVRKSPQGSERGDLLLEHFSQLDRGDTRLVVVGGVRSRDDIEWSLAHGADAVMSGVGAIPHPNLAADVLDGRAFRVRDLPVDGDVLRREAVSPAFLRYLRETFPHLVRGTDE